MNPTLRELSQQEQDEARQTVAYRRFMREMARREEHRKLGALLTNILTFVGTIVLGVIIVVLLKGCR